MSFSVSAAGTILSVSFLCADISQMMKYGAKETQNIRLWNNFETAGMEGPAVFLLSAVSQANRSLYFRFVYTYYVSQWNKGGMSYVTDSGE